MKENRIIAMEKYIAEKKKCSMEELTKHFNVSMMTVRNDIKMLVERGSVKKVYGGVEVKDTAPFSTFETRSMENLDVKEAIARCAAEEIENDDIIFVDSGTTTMHIVKYIDSDKKVTIITHNFNAASQAIEMENITLIMLPGILDRKTNSFMDVRTPEILRQYNISKAFLATSCITPQGSLGNGSSLECSIKSQALKSSVKRYVLADDSKLKKTALMTFGYLEDVDVLIMNDNPSVRDPDNVCNKVNKLKLI